MFARKPCRRVSKDNERTSGKTTLPSIIVLHRADIEFLEIAIKRTSFSRCTPEKRRVSIGKNRQLRISIGFSNLYFKKSVGPCKRCKKITFLHFPRCQSLKKKKIRVVTRVSSILVSHRWVWRHKKKEKKMYNDDCKYTGCKFYSRVCKIDSNSDKRKCWYVKSINCWDFLTIFLFVFIF